jgi:hypothetical protein
VKNITINSYREKILHGVVVRLSVSLCLLTILFLLPGSGRTQAEQAFREVEIETGFHDLLVRHPMFMEQGGARLFEADDGRLVLIGVGKVFPEDHRAEAMIQVRRKGEIRARAAILELGESMEISTSRSQKEQSLISLSFFFQVTETRLEGMIQQLPVIGSWWSSNHSTFYLAVGKIVNAAGRQSILTHISLPLVGRVGGGVNTDDLLDMEEEKPFLSLLRASPVLCRNGGVRGFLFENDRKALIAVGSARVQGSMLKARRIAQLKAVRSLLAGKQCWHSTIIGGVSCGSRTPETLPERGRADFLIPIFVGTRRTGFRANQRTTHCCHLERCGRSSSLCCYRKAFWQDGRLGFLQRT